MSQPFDGGPIKFTFASMSNSLFSFGQAKALSDEEFHAESFRTLSGFLLLFDETGQSRVDQTV